MDVKLCEALAKKYNEAYKNLGNELASLKARKTAEEKMSISLDQTFSEIVEQLGRLSEEKLKIETKSKQHELKMKSCSDETKQKLKTTRAELISGINCFKEKNELFKNQLNFEIKLLQKENIVKYIFSTNKQEILVSIKEPKNAFYTECAPDMEQNVRDYMDKLIDEFNSSSKKDLKYFILTVRELFI